MIRRTAWNVSVFAQAHAVECPKCSAKPGENCTRKDGRKASTLHNERLRLWKQQKEAV